MAHERDTSQISVPHGGGGGEGEEEESSIVVSSQIEEETISLLASHSFSKGQEDEKVSDSEQDEVKKEIESDEDDEELRDGALHWWNWLGLQSFVRSYRSTNPQKRITPFAVVLLLVLLSLYILNQADRLVLAVLIPSGLRCKLNDTNSSSSCPVSVYPSDNESLITDGCISFNDAEQGLLTGPAFVIVYVLAGLPLAYLADTRSRSLVLLVGIGFWSVMVFLTGFVNQFWELLLLRILLGVGEVCWGICSS